MYQLKKVQTPEEWRRYHDIRRTVLFEERGRPGVYQEDHPDEYLPENHAHLLHYEGQPVGTVRLDLKDNGDCILRLVGFPAEERGKGHGRALLARAEKFALAAGAKRLVVNAAPDALGFYGKGGFVEAVWDKEELTQESVADCTQMVKRI